MNQSETPLQEAISILSIGAMLVAVGCYVAAFQNVPILAPFLFWVAVQVFSLFPVLNHLPGTQVPMLVAAAAVGLASFFLTIPLAPLLAGIFSRAGLQSLERHTYRLKKHREKLKVKKRNQDNFITS